MRVGRHSLRLLVVVWGGLAAIAFAHGLPPQTLEVAPRPASTELLVDTTFGGLLSVDDGASYQWLCEEAVGLASGQRASWLFAPTGTLYAGAFAGLFVSRDHGCSWSSLEAFAASGVASMTQSGGLLYVTSARYGVTNRLWVSRDDGVSFAPTAVASATEYYSSVLVAPSAPTRVYVGAWYFDPPLDAVLVSDDSGATFTRITLTTALPNTGALTLLAVHPVNPAVLLATVTEDARVPRSWLLKSDDGAQTFSVVLQTTAPVTQAAFDASGQHAWVAAGDVLYASQNAGLSWAPLPSPTRSTCVHTDAHRTWVCGNQEADGFALASSPQTDVFTPALRWAQVTGVAQCPADSRTTTMCSAYWPVLAAQLGLDAGSGSEGVSPTPTKQCGCEGVPGATALLCAVFLGRLARRPRLRSRR